MNFVMIRDDFLMKALVIILKAVSSFVGKYQ